MSLKYEPSSEPLHIFAERQVVVTRETKSIRVARATQMIDAGGSPDAYRIELVDVNRCVGRISGAHADGGVYGLGDGQRR